MVNLDEDDVRDNSKIVLGFDDNEDGVKQGTGQIKTFNQLGLKGDDKNKKPDGWYLPNDKTRGFRKEDERTLYNWSPCRLRVPVCLQSQQ